MISAILVVLVASGLAAVRLSASSPTVSPTPSTRDAWSSLRRPVTLPSLPPGASCPVSSYQMMTSLDPSFSAGDKPQRYQAFGDGPAYPILYNFDVGIGVRFRSYAVASAGWYWDKVLWRVAPTYHGPALIRGRQLDGPHTIRFFAGNPARLYGPDPGQAELQVDSTVEQGWRDQPSAMLLQTAGCYGFQIDTDQGSKVVVFRAID